ncbi:MAG: hypothetical protein CMQ19_03980 [Gammaproteobacteria bacterium]|jgi:hypothetical protein|nr:hypothetical protein [Gammaproteobacteria bacterium]|tara:strand:+ start:1653 stop:1868 length:216 start_codon:yes stop_codon:yes gene_type:complete
MQKPKITKDVALSFLLTYMVVDKGREMKIDQITLFEITNLAQQAADTINEEDDVIPHEVIEALANEYLQSK